ARERARAVIVDVTGVPVVDTMVAKALVQMAQGVRLLGALPILVGIRAEIAETIVDLGVDLQGIVIQAGLQQGLLYALEQVQEDRLENLALVLEERS
ncbi:MAG: STAS domain-containing protein, partial [Chloroflexia bacterium]|nr:STAS domain-containing protein [Chloroflexia bacterium]